MDAFIDVLLKNYKMLLTFLIIVLSLLLIWTVFSLIYKSFSYNKKTRSLISGTSENEVKPDNSKKKTKKIKTKQNIFVCFYKEYMFFGGTKAKFISEMLIGYILSYVVFFLLSNSFLISAALALTYFDVFYIVIDKKNEKHRKKYIKSFSLALRTLTASTEAGNSFEEAVALITKRESIGTKIREEFACLKNNLTSNKSMEEALNDFWTRNNMFPEFSMFVIVMQFYSLKGGSGLAKILLQLEKTLDNKVESYSEIDTELGIHKTLMNILIYGYFGFLLIIKFIVPTFFIDIVNSNLGIFKIIISVALLFVSTLFFKSMIRSAAEG